MKLRPSFAEIVVRLRRMKHLPSAFPVELTLSTDAAQWPGSGDQLGSSTASTNSNLTEIEIRIDDTGLHEDVQEFEQLEREGQAVDDEDDQRARLLDEYDQTV